MNSHQSNHIHLSLLLDKRFITCLFYSFILCYSSFHSTLTCHAFSVPTKSSSQQKRPMERSSFRLPWNKLLLSTSSLSSSSSSSNFPSSSSYKNFREAEIDGLRYMQQGSYQQALDVFQYALTLPGSKMDIIRTKLLSGPSPVGGAAGGTEGKVVYTLDEFEYQAAHYNMACAYAQLNQREEAMANLEKAFQYGFDNFATVLTDPDLRNIQQGQDSTEPLLEQLIQKYDPKRKKRTQKEKGGDNDPNRNRSPLNFWK